LLASSEEVGGGESRLLGQLFGTGEEREKQEKDPDGKEVAQPKHGEKR
jgi:hypothetical protein